MEYKIVIDQQVVDEYNTYYFEEHPRARKKPIERPELTSMNQILILKRPQVVAWKSKMHEFGLFLVNKYGYENLMLDNYELEVRIYRGNKHRADIDNSLCGLKGILDPLVDAKMLSDDSYFYMKRLVGSMEYDKDNPRVELIFKVIEDY